MKLQYGVIVAIYVLLQLFERFFMFSFRFMFTTMHQKDLKVDVFNYNSSYIVDINDYNRINRYCGRILIFKQFLNIKLSFFIVQSHKHLEQVIK